MSEHREGTLFYDTETGRYDIRFDLESFYGGLHCGECFDVKVKDIWIPVRIEMGVSGWTERVEIRWTESTYVNRRISLMRGSTMRESVTDVRIILECLQEAYQMEGDMVRSGKNIHATMIYPFVRMLQEKCRDLTEEQIHKTLWKEYEISGADRMFVERASKILEQYEGESEDEK